MMNPFATQAMAEGYADRRPPVHPRVMERAARALGWRGRFRRAVDVGCGAGISTRALLGWTDRAIGVEPAVGMLGAGAAVAPGAWFVAGEAERLPLAAGSCELMTAAGSLNYADVERFFPEARRVLADGGWLLVYDFTPGRRFREGSGLEEWFGEFQRRYPPPVHEARALDAGTVAALAQGFREAGREEYEVGIPLSREFYEGYMMTETNVAAAVRAGVPEQQIRDWCRETLAPFWGLEEREVVFQGYWVGLRAGLDRMAE